jgi:hypothetical protein
MEKHEELYMYRYVAVAVEMSVSRSRGRCGSRRRKSKTAAIHDDVQGLLTPVPVSLHVPCPSAGSQALLQTLPLPLLTSSVVHVHAAAPLAAGYLLLKSNPSGSGRSCE